MAYHTVNAVQIVVTTGLPEAIHCKIGTRASERHTHETRGASTLTLPRIRTEAGRRRLCYRGVRMLNVFNVPIVDRRYRNCLRRTYNYIATDPDVVGMYPGVEYH